MYMHCEASFNSDSHHSLLSGVNSSITLDDIRVNDKVLIKTIRGVGYQFCRTSEEAAD